jgi:hypothetical protein
MVTNTIPPANGLMEMISPAKRHAPAPIRRISDPSTAEDAPSLGVTGTTEGGTT